MIHTLLLTLALAQAQVQAPPQDHETVVLANRVGEWRWRGPVHGNQVPTGEWQVEHDDRRITGGGDKVHKLDFLSGGERCVVWLECTVTAIAAHECVLSFGFDDALTLSVNGEQLFRADTVQPCTPNQHQVRAKLRAGENTVSLRLENKGAGMAFQWKIADPGDALRQIGREHGHDGFDQYRITRVPVPDALCLEVGGMAFTGRAMLVCTRHGDVWRIADPRADPPQITKWAEGLHEPLGMLAEADGSVLIMQKPELTRVADTDRDGRADRFDTVVAAWGLSGNYHEYAFGPVRDGNGDLWGTLNIGFPSGKGDALRYRGSAFRLTKEGRFEIACHGLRSPNGLVVLDSGEVFYADNQGEWMDTCRLAHLQPGKFYGHTTSQAWAKDMPGLEQKERTLPAIWVPYHLCHSLSWPVVDRTGGKFGPYAGQLFCGDQTNCNLIRMSLQKVDGTWQGACYPFWRGFQCGVNRLLFDERGTLWAGETERGWGSVGPKSFGLERIEWSGQTPFDLREVTATHDGFELAFTKPVAKDADLRKERFYVREYGYHYWSNYGSDEIEDRRVEVTDVRVSADRMKVSLTTGTRNPGKVFQIQMRGRVLSETGEPSVTCEAFYTLLRIP